MTKTQMKNVLITGVIALSFVALANRNDTTRRLING